MYNYKAITIIKKLRIEIPNHLHHKIQLDFFRVVLDWIGKS